MEVNACGQMNAIVSLDIPDLIVIQVGLATLRRFSKKKKKKNNYDYFNNKDIK